MLVSEKVIAGALIAQLGTMTSKVEGRRNWAISTFDDKAYVGGFGQLKRAGLLRCLLIDIAEHGILFREFTYKKDWQEAVEKLKAAGYKIIPITG